MKSRKKIRQIPSEIGTEIISQVYVERGIKMRS